MILAEAVSVYPIVDCPENTNDNTKIRAALLFELRNHTYICKQLYIYF